MDTEKRIISLLEKSGVDYKIYEHEPVYTCEQAARVRGVRIDEGIKCLLLKTDRHFILVLTRGDKKIDFEKINLLENSKSLRLANEKEIENIAECKIGCVHPFSNEKKYFDKILLQQEMIEFNPGCHNKTVRIKVNDLLELLKKEEEREGEKKVIVADVSK